MNATFRFLFIIALIALFAWLLERGCDAEAHLSTRPTERTPAATLVSQKENVAHALYVCRHGGGHHRVWACWAGSSVIRSNGQGWLRRELRETQNRLRKPSGLEAAWAWYYRSETQCVVNHEGGWTSVGPTANDGSWYAGRFQMDASFERETTFGARMQDRYGRAISWPPWAQVFHAHEVWVYAGWSRWPTYARYCT